MYACMYVCVCMCLDGVQFKKHTPFTSPIDHKDLLCGVQYLCSKISSIREAQVIPGFLLNASWLLHQWKEHVDGQLLSGCA